MSRPVFTDDFLDVLGSWQQGWRENQDVRIDYAANLERIAGLLPIQFRAVASVCFRKRFLEKGELLNFFLDGISDGTTSWTTDNKYAERFKGLVRPGAVTAAVFKFQSSEAETVLNIPALWADFDFRQAAES